MSRYIRFSYVVPRLVALLVLFALSEFGAGYFLGRVIIGGGQQVVGARVDVGRTKVSLLSAQATVEGLQIANPSKPMENLLEADRLDLDFDANSLLRGKTIVERGVLRGARFGVARESSGALDPSEEAQAGAAAPAWLADLARDTGGAWAKKLGGDVEARLRESIDGFESPKLADSLAIEWQRRYEKVRDDAETLQEDARTFRDDMKVATENPLRHAEQLAAAPERLSGMRRRLDQLKNEVTVLPSDIERDRARIAAARRADEQRLREALQTDQLDPNSLTTQLLGDSIMQPVTEAIGWLRWARQMTPSGKPSPRTVERRRGVDVRFLGAAERPDLLVRTLDLSGTATLAGRPVEVTGVVTGLTTQPQLHGAPLRVVLSTMGGANLEVRGEVDRTSQSPREVVQIDCPNFTVPSLQLGPAAGLTLLSSPSTGSLTVSLETRGETLTGLIQLVQNDVSLTPSLADDASRFTRQLAQASEGRLGRLSQAATRVTLSGTLSVPKVDVWSSLGGAVAQSLGGAAEGVIAAERDRLLAESNAQLQAKLAGYQQKLAPMHEAVSKVLAGSGGELQSVASAVTRGGLGRGTLSFESLGKKIPGGGSLFR